MLKLKALWYIIKVLMFILNPSAADVPDAPIHNDSPVGKLVMDHGNGYYDFIVYGADGENLYADISISGCKTGADCDKIPEPTTPAAAGYDPTDQHPDDRVP